MLTEAIQSDPNKLLPKVELPLKGDNVFSISISVNQKLFYQNLYTSGPLIPYKIIRHITQNKLHGVIEHVVHLVYGKDDSSFSGVYEKQAVLGPEMSRNCTNTVFALALIFLGHEATKRMAEYLHKGCNTNFQISLPSGKTWGFTVNELFDGNISHDISCDDKFDSMDIAQKLEVSIAYREKYAKRFLETIQPTIDAVKNGTSQTDEEIITGLQKKFSVLQYNFNKTTIEFLEKDIFERNKKVNSKQSFIYVFRVTISDPELGKERLIEHSWILEQFFSESTQKAAFRLYQSCIGQATLSDEFVNRKYGPKGENHWNVDKLKEFLHNLNTYYCSNPTERTSITFHDCFGYLGPSFPVLKFNGLIFSGKSLQYRIYAFDPEQCIKNFELLSHL